MKQCFGYTRVSTIKQGEGVSLEAQRDAIEAFAARNEIIISKWFEEKETAAKCGRPIFNRMVMELKRRKADGLVIHKIDRSARNFADWAKIGDLADAGFDIHFATESLDFSSRGGRLTADIQAVIAADYIRNLRDETIKGIQGRLKQGLYPFKAPIGYLDNGRGKPKTVDPVRGPLVRQLFDLYATGNYSLWTLRAEAKELGLRNNGGEPLAKTSIEKILRNPFYVGVIKIKRTSNVYAGIHEPLVTPTLFEQVTAVRVGRDNKKSTKHNHRYRGLFQCGHCASAMIPELQKGRVYYRCHQKECVTKTLREDKIEEAIQSFLKRYSLNEVQVSILRDHFKQWLDGRDNEGDAKHADFELVKLDKRLSILEDKLLDGVIDDDTYNRKKTDILMDRQRWYAIAKQRVRKAIKLERLEKFLELVKCLYVAYVSAVSVQKREIVKFATSNRRIFSKKVELEPSSWMQMFDSLVNFDYCDPARPSSRTFEALEGIMNKLEESDYEELFEKINPLGQ
ncbi:MAG: recombinase family protein [Candidatus Thiodiazotropha sp. (ex Troendleina suluensis)]|nr:recombinase family protein [Candidatus Thiodiazotropha sp. (ex Troendleina suluensis)]